MTTRKVGIAAAVAAVTGIFMTLYVRYTTRDISRSAADAMNKKSMYE